MIDAELYTGDIEADLGAMEYNDADRVAIAVVQARGLASEKDYPDEGEDPIKPRLCGGDETDSFRSVRLLTEHGLAELSPHEFEEVDCITGCTVQTLRCRRCGFESFAWSQTARSIRARDMEKIGTLIRELGEYVGHGSEGDAPEHCFQHDCESISEQRMIELYALGERLVCDCPENDCTIYRNTFLICRDFDAQLSRLTGYARDVMRRDFTKRLHELDKLYMLNHAICNYRRELQQAK